MKEESEYEHRNEHAFQLRTKSALNTGTQPGTVSVDVPCLQLQRPRGAVTVQHSKVIKLSRHDSLYHIVTTGY
jgi:hypothetical protein